MSKRFVSLKTVERLKPKDCMIVRIRSTLELSHIQVSEALFFFSKCASNPIGSRYSPNRNRYDGSGVIVPMMSGGQHKSLVST